MGVTHTVTHTFVHEGPTSPPQEYYENDLLALKSLIARQVVASPGVHRATFDAATAIGSSKGIAVTLKEIGSTFRIAADESAGEVHQEGQHTLLGHKLTIPSGKCNWTRRIVYDITITYEVVSVM